MAALLSSPPILSLRGPTSFFSSPNLRFLSPLRSRLIQIQASVSKFDISFSPPKTHSPSQKTLTLVPDPNPLNLNLSQSQLQPQPQPQPVPLVTPWIVRDESGNIKLQSTPPAPFLHAMAEAKESALKKESSKKAKKKKNLKTAAAPSSSSPPPYSKAARRFYNQEIRESQRLNKVLAAAGVASRRSCEELIFEGKVTVNGSVCTSPETRVDILKDSIYVNGNRLSKKMPPKLYFALNKPNGYICSSGVKSRSVLSLFDGLWKTWNKTNPGVPKPRLFTVGRLDVATTGLIIVTNDGDFAQSLAHPSSELSKEYIATIQRSVHRRHLKMISKGTQVEGVHCVPDFVELLPVQPDARRARLRIVVHEGRTHEVRELVKNVGLQLYSLKRVRIGAFRLPKGLGVGKYVELKQSDLKLLGEVTGY